MVKKGCWHFDEAGKADLRQAGARLCVKIYFWLYLFDFIGYFSLIDVFFFKLVSFLMEHFYKIFRKKIKLGKTNFQISNNC